MNQIRLKIILMSSIGNIFDKLDLGHKLYMVGVTFQRDFSKAACLYVGSFQDEEIISLPPQGLTDLINSAGIHNCVIIL